MTLGTLTVALSTDTAMLIAELTGALNRVAETIQKFGAAGVSPPALDTRPAGGEPADVSSQTPAALAVTNTGAAAFSRERRVVTVPATPKEKVPFTMISPEKLGRFA